MRIIDCGLVEFHAAYATQERLAGSIAAGTDQETLLLLEHPPVYTIGSGGDEANLLNPAISAVRTNRGGDVTFHGPGQLVGYPLLDLSRRSRDLHRYLRFLEEVLIRTAQEFAVDARCIPGKTGIWTERGKLASIGIGIRRWVTMHGFALNCSGSLSGFTGINPCGIPGCTMTSLEAERETVQIEMVAVKGALCAKFISLLNEELPPRDLSFSLPE